MRAAVAALVVLGLTFAASAAEPARPDLELEVRLLHALAAPPTAEDEEAPPYNPAPSLLLDLARAGERWEKVWGLDSSNRKPQVTNGRVDAAEVTADRVVLEMRLLLAGVSPLRVEFARDGDALEGAYTLTRDGRAVTGRAVGRVKPPRPPLPKGFEPVRPGERPRILFRASDLPALRAKAKTPLGKVLVEHMGREDHLDAIGAGVRYQLSGDAAWADRARQFAADHMAGKGRYSHRTAWGRHPEQVAIAFDLCRDAWPAAFREEVLTYLRATGETYVNCAVASGGMNWHVSSNWAAKPFSGAGFLGLALWGEKGPKPPKPAGPNADALLDFWKDEAALHERLGGADMADQRIFERSRYFLYLHAREGAGTGGFRGECSHYGLKATEMVLEYAACYRRMFGHDVSPWPDLTHVVPRQTFGHVFPEDLEAKPIPVDINGFSDTWGNFMSYGFPIAPERWRPALLWAWNRKFGVADADGMAAHLAERDKFDEHGTGEPTWFFLSYPLDAAPKPPGEAMPLTWGAPDFGYYGFRNGWTGTRDVLLQTYAKARWVGGWNGPNAGTFHLWGLGGFWNHDTAHREIIPWETNRVVLPDDETFDSGSGRVVHVETEPDGSGCVSIDMTDVYAAPSKGMYSKYGGLRYADRRKGSGIRALRSIAVDYSGACGAPCLFVLVDRFEGGGRKVWTWNLGKAEAVGQTVVEGNTVTRTRGDAVMRGTFIAPAGVEVEAKVNAVTMRGRKGERVRRIPSILATGGDSFFFVATIGPAEAAPAQIKVQGAGLAARITVGEQTVRFDGTKVAFGERK